MNTNKIRTPQLVPLEGGKKSEINEKRQQKAAEASKIMGRLNMIIERQRIFDRYVIRIRCKDTMQILWSKRGMNADTILTEMLRWLRKKEEEKKTTQPLTSNS